MVFSAAMKAPLFCILLFVAGNLGAAGPVRELTAAEWDRPRSGEFVAGIPVLKETVRAFDARPGRALTIRYPGDEAGLLWAEELRSWLVALGIESSRIVLAAGARRTDALELVVETD
jgi:hypothetical protein